MVNYLRFFLSLVATFVAALPDIFLILLVQDFADLEIGPFGVFLIIRKGFFAFFLGMCVWLLTYYVICGKVQI